MRVDYKSLARWHAPHTKSLERFARAKNINWLQEKNNCIKWDARVGETLGECAVRRIISAACKATAVGNVSHLFCQAACKHNMLISLCWIGVCCVIAGKRCERERDAPARHSSSSISWRGGLDRLREHPRTQKDHSRSAFLRREEDNFELS